MAKIVTNKEGVAPDTDGASRGQREKLWEEFVEAYKVSNPVKYEMKKASFATIPDSFKGIVTEMKTLKGVRRVIQ